jgi:hypothetical protein
MVTPQIAFLTEGTPAMVQINFGVFAGRQATPAEIDSLAQGLLPIVGGLSIVAEQRHEIDDHSEASLSSVRVELEQAIDDEVAGVLLARCEHWAQSCIAERQAEINEI